MSDWIEHDGKGCPCFGQWVAVWHEGMSGIVLEIEGRAGQDGGESWDWRKFGAISKNGKRITKIIRYRIRKPRGLTILENLVASLDAPEGPVMVPKKVKAKC